MITKATVKYIQSLQHKKFRDEYNMFIAEGPKVVKELLDNNLFDCEHIYCTACWLTELNKDLADGNAEKICIVKDFELEKISALATANNVLAVFHKKKVPENINIANTLALVLDDIQDPGNLGTIIRIADWFAVPNIFCSKACADCYNPKVVQSTMASLGRVNIVYTDICELIRNNAHIKKYAAVLGGNDIKSAGKIREGFVILGNESKGISKDIVDLADEKISIGKIGNAESLNVAVAAGIILFAIS